MKILAFETSCDETSAAVLENQKVLSNVISSQLFHSEYGGVVPEIASRAHVKNILTITQKALEDSGNTLADIDAIAATTEPGLIGALLVGMNFGKSIAVSLGKPFIPVNHIHAHLYSNFLGETKPSFPFVSLIVSGGHTMLVLVKDNFSHKVLGRTVDDAAGEAFDKGAKMMGLGYPGGPEIDRRAKQGDEKFHRFPLAHLKNKEFDFSFSGLKTSLLYYLRQIKFNEIPAGEEKGMLLNNICASYQEAIVNSLFHKTFAAAKKFNIKDIAIAGGVSANSALKQKFNTLSQKGYNIFIPSLQYSTDNAAMIGITAYMRYTASPDKDYFMSESLAVNAKARLDYERF